MSEPKWQEGVWYAVRNSRYWDVSVCTEGEHDGVFGIGYQYNQSIASVIIPDDKEAEGSIAHLMAASKDMHKALSELVFAYEVLASRSDSKDYDEATMLNARATLAKANPSTLHAAQPKENQ